MQMDFPQVVIVRCFQRYLITFTVFMLSATLDREDLERAEGHPIVEALLPKPLDVHQLRGWTDQIPLKGI